MGTHLKFSTSCHPQTDGQTEVTNRTLGTLLRVLVKKHVKTWDELLPHAEFAFNRAPSKVTHLSPFQVVYGYNPRTPLDLVPVPTHHKFSWEAAKRAKEIQDLHAQVRERIEKANAQAMNQANKHKKEVHFQPGDLVWIHMRKERFPHKRKSKIMPRSDGPFEILEKVGPNAYKVDLSGEYGVSATFNVADLRPYYDEKKELPSLRSNSFQPGEDDGDHHTQPNEASPSDLQALPKPKEVQEVQQLIKKPLEYADSEWTNSSKTGPIFVTFLSQVAEV